MSYQLLMHTIQTSTNDELKCLPYKKSRIRLFFFYLLSLLSLGFFNLILSWKPNWKVKFTKVSSSLEDCDAIILIEDGDEKFVEKICFLGDISVQDNLLNSNKKKIRYFEHKCLRYIWDDEEKNFCSLRGFQPKCMELFENYGGLSRAEYIKKELKYGKNSIEVGVKSYWTLLISEVLNPFYVFQILSIILWSADTYYYYAGCIFVISCISVAVSLYETRKQSQTLHDMISANLIPTVIVWRKGQDCEEIPSSDVVPGDIIVIPECGTMMCCDAVLITGNCIVNESMLTGESVPVTKTPLSVQDENEVYCPEIHRRHTLYSGTEIVQTRYYGNNKVLAVVVRTGFLTAKGELIRSIMFPKPIGFTFYKDSIKFIIVLFMLACGGMIYSVYSYIERHASIKSILLRGLDIFTIVVPPSLPAAMTVGTVYAQSRMKKKGIFCISPPRINVSGKIKVVCFDKTGTLTEDGLDLHGIVIVENMIFSSVIKDPKSIPKRDPFLAAMATCHSLTLMNGNLSGDPLDVKMFEATNWDIEEHGVDSSRYDLLMPTVVRPKISDSYQHATLNLNENTELLQESGKDSSKYENISPSTVKPVIDTYYIKSDPNELPYEIGIVRQFTFSSSLQRMSVIVRRLGADNMDAYVKGAPEKISSLCLPETVPSDFSEILHKYSIVGFRVLALAFKPFSTKVTWHQAQRMKRDRVESDLHFLGLLLMQNALKPETKPVINLLHNAELKTVMVTGDNMLTAVSVARECMMLAACDQVIYLKAHPSDGDRPSFIDYDIDDCKNQAMEAEIFVSNELKDSLIKINDDETSGFQYAIDGKSFGVIRSDFPKKYEELLVKGKVFARMAPDQKTQLIEDLQKLDYIVGMCGDGANDCGALKAAHVGISLSEAEASVAAPFTSKIPNIKCVPEVIKEGRCALVTSFGVFKYMALYSMIQFISVLILYTEGSILSDMMFLYIDLCITTTVAVLMGLTGPYNKIVRRRPQGSLISFVTLASVISQTLVCLAVQLLSLYFLQHQKWYLESKVSAKDKVVCWETTVIFCVSSFQYIILAVTFSKGPPYRQPIYKNTYFFVAVIVLFGMSVFLLMEPVDAITVFFKLKQFGNHHLLFKAYLMCVVLAHIFIALTLEVLISSDTFKKIIATIKRKRTPKNRFKRLELNIQESSMLSTESSRYSPTIS